MGIVKGFTDIIAPQNLATNGSFRINQRGLFQNTFAPAKVNDFICDAWFIGPATTVDYLEALWAGAQNYIRFKGHGKKGQFIYFENRVADKIMGDPSHTTNVIPVTAAVTVNSVIKPVGLPLDIVALPRRQATGHQTNYAKSVRLNYSANYTGTSVSCITTLNQPQKGGLILITLLADGEFDLILNEFREIYGHYINPPPAPVPLADDLLRCKRYYQTGTLRNEPTSRGSFFPVEMAGSPTIEIKNGSVLLGAASWDEVLPRSVSYADPKGFQSYRYLSTAVSGSGSITRYVTPMNQATLSVKLGTSANSVSSTYGTASNSGDAVSTNPMLLGSGSNGTPGTRSVAITEISATKITVTYTNAVAGDGLFLWVSGADAGATENSHYWTATV